MIKTTDNEDDEGEMFEGEVISYSKPYWKVRYFEDGDEEDMTLAEVLECIL